MPTLVKTRGTVVQAEFYGIREGQSIQNVLHWSNLDETPFGSASQYTAIDLETLIQTQFTTNLIPEIHQDYTLERIVFKHITSIFWGLNKENVSFGTAKVTDTPVGIAGGLAPSTEPMPTFNSIGIQKIAENRTKFYRGSMRLDGVREGDSDKNLLDGVRVVAVQNAMNLFNVPLTVVDDLGVNKDFHFSIFSRTFGYTPGGTETDPGATNCQAVAQTLVKGLVTSQVSRKQRGGGS